MLRQRHLDDLSKTEAIHVLVSTVLSQLMELQQAINNDSQIDASRHSRRLTELQTRLSSINPFECPGSGNTMVVVDLPFRIHDLCTAADALMAQRRHKTPAISAGALTDSYNNVFHFASMMTRTALAMAEKQRDRLVILAGVTDFEE